MFPVLVGRAADEARSLQHKVIIEAVDGVDAAEKFEKIERPCIGKGARFSLVVHELTVSPATVLLDINM